VWGLTKQIVYILCTLLPFIKACKRQPDDGTVSGPRHVAVSQYNSCVEMSRFFFQSVWICRLGYNPNDHEIRLISGMRKSIFSFIFTQTVVSLQPPVQWRQYMFPQSQRQEFETNKLHPVPWWRMHGAKHSLPTCIVIARWLIIRGEFTFAK